MFKKTAVGVVSAGIVFGSHTFAATSANAATTDGSCTANGTSVTCTGAGTGTVDVTDIASALTTALASYKLVLATIQAIAQQFETALQKRCAR